jgi:hypothetical protein
MQTRYHTSASNMYQNLWIKENKKNLFKTSLEELGMWVGH